MSNRSSFEFENDNHSIENEKEVETTTMARDTASIHDSPVTVTEIQKDNWHDSQLNEDDEFGDDFVDADDIDDDFGDFDDFESEPVPSGPTEAEQFFDVLSCQSAEKTHAYFDDYLGRLWDSKYDQITETVVNDEKTGILNTSCSYNLWSKLSCDTVFYNPITGAAGQFQWTRSETNKRYLNALGVTIKHEKPVAHRVVKKREKANIVLSPVSSPSLETSPTIKRSASVSKGLTVVTPMMDETTKEAKKEAEQELELDIDIARAYCELTEETIRVFPNVKLNAMVTELTRLQKQAGEYLDQLLDQREQLKMDAETYNDLISCIVGHAQRLHVHSKDGSPAMVTKTKKSNGTFNFSKLKTSTASTQQSASMGGGVVGLKKPAAKNTSNRSHNTTDTK